MPNLMPSDILDEVLDVLRVSSTGRGHRPGGPRSGASIPAHGTRGE